jgi:hypothetical protein
VFGSRNDPFELGQKWMQLFPDAEQHTIPGGNHYPMGDDPAGVSALIRAGTARPQGQRSGVLALLERYTSRAQATWTALALAALTSSIVPIFVFLPKRPPGPP